MSEGPAIGERVGAYVLERPIGAGGMGSVFFARHELLGRKAAVKILDSALAEDQAFVSRFFHEAKIVNDVRHPNIVDIVDFIRQAEPKRVAYVMEFVEGQPLGVAARARPFSVLQAIRATRQLTSAIAAVHAIGVVHRDLKPANVLLTVDPATSDLSVVPCLKVLDFGIAKVADQAVGHKTSTGMMLGTPGYMAPEQVAGEAVSPATDVYAIGEIFYELVSSRPVFSGPTASMLRAKLDPAPPKIELPAGLPFAGELTSLIQRCLAYAPEERPSTAQLIAELDRLEIDVVASPSAPAGLPVTQVEAAFATEAPATAPGASPAPPTTGLEPPRPSGRLAMAVAGITAMVFGAVLTSWLMEERVEVVPLAGSGGVEPAAPPEARAAAEVPPPAPTPTPTAPTPTPTAPTPTPTPTPTPAEPLAAVEPTPAPPKVAPEPPTRPTPGDPERRPRPTPVAEGRAVVEAWTTAGRALSARVLLDGKPLAGRTPVELKASIGKHKVRVEAPDYPPVEQTFDLAAGEPKRLRVIVDLD